MGEWKKFSFCVFTESRALEARIKQRTRLQPASCFQLLFGRTFILAHFLLHKNIEAGGIKLFPTFSRYENEEKKSFLYCK